MYFFKKNFKNTIFTIIGIIIGALATKIYFLYLQPSYVTINIDNKNAIMENGFCYFQPVKDDKITYHLLNQQSLENQCAGQSRVDVGSFQNEDTQRKILSSLYNEVKNIHQTEFNESDIWVTSDIHGDIKMLLQGLLQSGLITWDGSLKREYFQAYKDKRLPIIYPDVNINNKFNGLYINLGDIINKNAFGIACLYLLHDIYKKTQNKDKTHHLIKILFGNHEYHDLLPSTITAYKETLINFIDMFDAYFEKNGIIFSHAPITFKLKPKNQKDIDYLNSLIKQDDANFTLKHLLYGYEGKKNFPTIVTPSNPATIIPNSVSGHTHGSVDLGYNNRKDVLNTAINRFSKDITKRDIIFKINTTDMSVYSYTSTTSNEIIKKQLDKQFNKK